VEAIANVEGKSLSSSTQSSEGFPKAPLAISNPDCEELPSRGAANNIDSSQQIFCEINQA
jgi:hypothetical protein